MKLVIYSMVAFCLMCHHHLFHRKAHACGGVQAQSFSVQSFGFAAPAPCYQQQSFAYYQPQPLLLAAPVYPATYAVAAPVQRAPRRQVIRTKTVVRTSF